MYSYKNAVIFPNASQTCLSLSLTSNRKQMTGKRNIDWVLVFLGKHIATSAVLARQSTEHSGGEAGGYCKIAAWDR